MTPRLRAALLRLLCVFMLPTLACSANPFAREPAPVPTVAATVAPTDAPTGALTAAPAAAAATAAPAIVADAPLVFTQALPAAVQSFNPTLTADAASHALIGKFLPRLIERDAQTGAPVATGLATGWTWSPDGAVLTVTLRSDLRWSDGAPITSRDVGFTLAALAAPAVQSPLRALVDHLSAVTPLGNGALRFELSQPDCTFLQTLTLPILPSHLFAADLSDITTNGWNQAPTVGAGPFLFVTRTPQGEIELERNPTYFKGAPAIATYRLRVIPSASERMRALLDGGVDLADDLPAGASALAGGAHIAGFLRDGYSMLVMNMADPSAPEPGRAEAGALQPQSPHPILGDVRVRQAIAQGVDSRRLLGETYGANAVPLTSWVLPTLPWAFAADLPAYRYDPAAARALLDEAGWLVGSNGVRVRNGVRLALTLATNNDNPQRLRLAEGLRAGLGALGFDITVKSLPFAEAADMVMQQTYDLAIIGWEQVGPDPAAGPWFDSRADFPGTGVNVTSYQNPIVDTLFDAARTVPACDLAIRGSIYQQIQRQVFAAVPIVPLNGVLDHVGVGAGWKNVNPGPWALDAGIETWDR